jgi:fumarate reductase subunit C
MAETKTAAGETRMSRRPYVRPVSRTAWYLHHARYRNYMLRELTCILVALYCVLLLVALRALASGQPERWADFLACQQHAGWIALHAFALVFFTIYQTMAWFRLAPKAMPLQVGDTAVPSSAIVAAHYVAWLAVSLVIFWLAGVF